MRLGKPADGAGRTIWIGRGCDNDAYCMTKCVWTGGRVKGTGAERRRVYKVTKDSALRIVKSF